MSGDDGYERRDISGGYGEERGDISFEYCRHGYRSQDISHSSS